MKKFKKLTALLLTLVMSLALAVPCFAADNTVKKDVYDLGNGIIATVTVQPADNVLKPYKANVDFNGTASPRDQFTLSLFPADGRRCDAHVMNMEELRSGINMSVHFDVLFHNGQKSELKSYTVAPRMNASIVLTDTTGAGLDCDITTTVSVVNTDSVDYNYWHFQN